MSARAVLPVLLGIVAGAAAVLSFAALRDLAVVCGFGPWLAWLLPVVVDAGAAAGSVVWLGGWAARSARRFARALALVLLGLSVAANALGHGLAAFALAPPWWVVVVVSAVAPAVLGAVVHLAVLVAHPAEPARTGAPPLVLVDEVAALHASIEAAGGGFDTRGLSRLWETAPPAAPPADPDRDQRAAELIAVGAGRRRLSRELGISEYEARQLLARTRTTPTGHGPGTSTDDTESTARDAAPEWVPAVTGSGGTSS